MQYTFRNIFQRGHDDRNIEQSKNTVSKYKVAGLMISCMYGLPHKQSESVSFHGSSSIKSSVKLKLKF